MNPVPIAAVLFGVLVVGAGSSNVNDRLASPPLTTPFAEWNCGFCPQCSTTQHANLPQENGTNAAIHQYCIGPDNCSGHPWCSAGGATADQSPDSAVVETRFAQLVDGLLDGSSDAAVTLLRDFPDRVHMNAERKALQFVACRQHYYSAHVPLNDRQLATIERVGLAE